MAHAPEGGQGDGGMTGGSSAGGPTGEEWSQILSSAHCLLNGETGRLDCGTLSRQIEDLRTSGGSPDAIQRANEATTPKAAPKGGCQNFCVT